MSEVASAWVTLIPSAKGFGKRTESELSGDLTKVGQSQGKKMGGGMAATLGRSLKIGAVGAAAGAGALVGTALWKGMGRLKAIDEAKGKLTGLGHSARGVEKIMNNALSSVKGTAFGLDEASSVAASAVAAGIKPGKDLTKNLKLVADAATIAGTDMGSMGAIFNKVAASNKVQMDVINQLHDAGVPALSLLAKQMGVTAEEASKMASDGEIDFATFQKAMDRGLGGAALESGKTFSGAAKNMQAALGRLGASVLAGVFPKIAPMLSKITVWLDQAGPYAERFGVALGAAFNWLGANLPKAWAAIQGFFASFRSGAGSSGGMLTNLKVTAMSVFSSLKAIFVDTKSIVMSLWSAFGPSILAFLSGSFTNIMTMLRGAFTVIRGIFKTVAALLKGDWRGAWDGIKMILRGALTFITGMVRQSMNLAKTIFRAAGVALKAIAVGIWNGVKAAFSAGVGKAVEAVRGLQAKAVNALRGAGTWLLETGKDVVRGLISGIGSLAGDVTSALLALLPAPLRKFANKLGIHSPSRVFMGFGENIVDGLILGVSNREPAANRSIGGLADAVMPPAIAGLSSPRLSQPLASQASPSSARGVVDLTADSVNAVATAILAGSRNVSVRAVDDREYMNAGALRYPSPVAGVRP